MMQVLLLDANEFSKVDGKIFHSENYYSFKIGKDWCPISKFKVDKTGNVYGRIANELIPKGIYNNITIMTDYQILIRKYDCEMNK